MRPFWPLTPPSLLREYDDTEAAKKALDQLGYRYEMESSEAHLLQLFHRAQRGLLSYEGVPVNELATFVAQRGLKVLTDRVSRSGKILRSALQTADEDLTFTRFSDLPRELQLSIMEFFFTSLSLLDLALPEHAQPPSVTHGLTTALERHGYVPWSQICACYSGAVQGLCAELWFSICGYHCRTGDPGAA